MGMSARTSLLEEYIRNAILGYCGTTRVADSLSSYLKTTALNLSRSGWIRGKDDAKIQKRLYRNMRDEIDRVYCLGYLKKGVDVDEVTGQAANAVRNAAEFIWRREGDNV